MSTHNFLRLFGELRLSPWITEHDRYIRARIAALEVEDPKEAVNKANQYAMILAQYHKDHPELAIAEMPKELFESLEKVNLSPKEKKETKKVILKKTKKST